MLSDKQITKLVHTKELKIEPFNLSYLASAGYDLRVGEQALKSDGKLYSVKEKGFMEILPGEMVSFVTLETLDISLNLVGRILPLSRVSNRGILSPISQIDPGYRGKVVFTLFNYSPNVFILNYGDPVLRIEFDRLDVPSKQPYRGTYQGVSSIPVELPEFRATRKLPSIVETAEQVHLLMKELQRTRVQLRITLAAIVSILIGFIAVLLSILFR